jgi:hypothetical protein
MRLLISALAFAVLVPNAAWGQAVAPGPSAAQLIGTWRLVQFEDLEDAAGTPDAAGRPVHRYGEAPLGLFIYTAEGYVAIQIADPANPRCVLRINARDHLDVPLCTPEQREARAFVAYWGTYTADMAAGVVVHHVQSDSGNGYAGTDQPRPFRVEGDRLVIGDGKTWTRVLERVR